MNNFYKNPSVSVVIPVYNGANFLKEAIDSVLSQTYSNFEIIVIDDGSTDNTWDIIQEYGDKVRGFHKENGGVASALNYGIKMMRGEWFAWLSHDDIWLPEKIERQIDFLNMNQNFIGCYTGYLEIDCDNKVLSRIMPPYYVGKEAVRKICDSDYIHGSSIIINQLVFKSVGLFSIDYPYTQDTNMWLRILLKFDLGLLSEYLIKVRLHKKQGSVNKNSIVIEAKYMFINFFYMYFLIDEQKTHIPFNKKRGIEDDYEWFIMVMLRRKYYDVALILYMELFGIKPIKIKDLINVYRCIFKIFLINGKNLIKKRNQCFFKNLS